MYGLHLFRVVIMPLLTNDVEDVDTYSLTLLTDVDETQYVTPLDTSIRMYSYELQGV